MCCQSVIVMHGQDREDFKMRHFTQVLHSSDCSLTLRAAEICACVCVHACASVCVCVCSAWVLHHSKPNSSDSNWWVGRILPLSLPLSLTLLRYLTLRPPTLAENLTAALQLAVKCVISKGERRQWFILLVLIQGLSLLWTWSTNPSLRCCYVVVVVVRLPWRWAVSRSEPRIRLRRV